MIFSRYKNLKYSFNHIVRGLSRGKCMTNVLCGYDFALYFTEIFEDLAYGSVLGDSFSLNSIAPTIPYTT